MGRPQRQTERRWWLRTDEPDRRGCRHANGKGDGTPRVAQSAQTAKLGANLTGLSVATIRSDPSANVCAGAAVLGSYRGTAATVAKSTDVNDWTTAVSRFGAIGTSSEEFARQVYATLRQGESRTTAEGQKVTLAAHPEARILQAKASPKTGCPRASVVSGCLLPIRRATPPTPTRPATAATMTSWTAPARVVRS